MRRIGIGIGIGIVWLLAVSAGTVPAAAQLGGSAVAGRVVDQTGAPLPGTLLTIQNVDTGLSRVAVTARDGGYAIPALPPGRYRLRAELRGFRPVMRDGLQLSTGETLQLDLQLPLGALSEAVTVQVDASMLRSATSSLGQVVDNRKIVDLPLNGRSFIALASLAPGVAVPPPPAAPLPRINGGRPRTNEYLFDGISVLQPEPGQVAFFPNIDAIQEFRIESNSPPAEFGRFNGGVINLTTKSGSNMLRGSLFTFVRHEALNARNFFAAAEPDAPPFRRQQFGGVVGGPIRRDRTFFFVDYQGQRQRIGRTRISTVPTLQQRQGVFTEAIGGRVPAIYDPATTRVAAGGTVTRGPFPDNSIPGDRIDPVARALLERYPLPTHPGTANNYRRTGDEIADQDQISLRLDHHVGQYDRSFGRLTRFAETFIPVSPLPDGSGVTSGTLGPQRLAAWSFASGYQRTFGPTLLNELRVGDTRRSVRRSAVQLPSSAASALGLPGLPATAHFPQALPAIDIGGYQQLGSPSNTASRFGTSVTEIADTLTWIKGRHAIKVGADLRWQRLDVIQPPSPTGAFTFSNLFTDLPGTPQTGSPFASFLLGQVQHFSIDLQQHEIRNRAHFQEYFVQDDWRVSDRVTVNAGLRYTLNFPSTEEHDQAAVFNLVTERLDFLGRDGQPRSARRLHKLDFGPRLGLAARLTDRTVARTGYGVIWIEMAGITTPFTTPAFPFLQTVTERTLDNLVPAFTLAEGPTVQPIAIAPDAGIGQGVFAVDRDLGSGYVQQWNIALQRELTPNVTVEAAYVGSKITRVGLPDSNLNQLTVEQLARGAELLQRVPNPYFGVIPASSSLGDPTITVAQLLKRYPMYTTVSLYRNNVGTTLYHGVQTKIEQRLSRRFSYLVSYTRSKHVDDASSVFDASILTGPVANAPVADAFNRRLDRDYSNGDIPHVLVASAVWDLPWRWTLTGVLTLQSGMPLAVTQTTNHNAFAGFGTQRPNVVDDPTLPASERSVERWFNTGAFSPAPAFTLGSSPRNPVRGPGFRNLDLAVIRRLPLRGSARLEVRAEVFNAMNTPHFLAPNTVVGAAGFGTITAAADPRVIQLALKVSF